MKIRNLIVMVFIVSVFGCTQVMETERDTILFPLIAGNYWIYDEGFIDDQSYQFDGFKIEVTDKVSLDYEGGEKEVYVVNLYELHTDDWTFLQSAWYSNEVDGLYLYYFNPGVPYDILRVKLHTNPIEIGDQWQSVLNEEFTLVEDDIDVSTEAGEFHCYEISSENGSGYFCSEIGFIKGWFYIAFWHGINTQLLEYGNYEN